MRVIEILQKLDDRLLMVALTVLVLGVYAATRDPLFGDMAKYILGATAGVMVARLQKTLTVTGDSSTAERAVKEFLGPEQ